MWAAVSVAALGYFVDIFDILLFSIVRIPSLTSLGLSESDAFREGVYIINLQLIGLLLGGIVWGIWADKIGRLSVLYGSILLYSIANLACGYVHTIESYAWFRFIAGFGLAGELGAGITLVSELLSKEQRGWGTTIVTGLGLLGAIAAGVLAETVSWRNCYIVGAILGFLLLFTRIKVGEGSAYKSIKNRSDIKKGSLLLMISSLDRMKRYFQCVFLGFPTITVVYIFATFAPEISKGLNIANPISASYGVIYCYIGIALGDFIYGAFSQLARSRKKSIKVSIIISTIILFIISFFPPNTANYYLIFLVCIGCLTATWGVILSISSEIFGTNLRATATTSVPNMIRGSAALIVYVFSILKQESSAWDVAIFLAFLSLLIAAVSSYFIKETYGVDLEYLEE